MLISTKGRLMLGWNAKRLLAGLARYTPNISTITLTSYEPASVLAERLNQTSTEPLSATEFVREALRHRGYTSPLDYIPIDALPATLAIEPAEGTVRGFCSRVCLSSGEEAQLPLLDFYCPVTNENTKALIAAVKLMGQARGALFTSGRSYHYYGLDPMTLNDWRRFMARSVLLAPLIDSRFVAHCLIEDLACLRIDARPKQQYEPTVIASLDE